LLEEQQEGEEGLSTDDYRMMLQETHKAGKEPVALHGLVCQICLRRLLHAFRGSVGIRRIKKPQQNLVDLGVYVLS
jgi:hypothetical protein